MKHQMQTAKDPDEKKFVEYAQMFPYSWYKPSFWVRSDDEQLNLVNSDFYDALFAAAVRFKPAVIEFLRHELALPVQDRRDINEAISVGIIQFKLINFFIQELKSIKL